MEPWFQHPHGQRPYHPRLRRSNLSHTHNFELFRAKSHGLKTYTRVNGRNVCTLSHKNNRTGNSQCLHLSCSTRNCFLNSRWTTRSLNNLTGLTNLSEVVIRNLSNSWVRLLLSRLVWTLMALFQVKVWKRDVRIITIRVRVKLRRMNSSLLRSTKK